MNIEFRWLIKKHRIYKEGLKFPTVEYDERVLQYREKTDSDTENEWITAPTVYEDQ